jgi:hypothetical protein
MQHETAELPNQPLSRAFHVAKAWCCARVNRRRLVWGFRNPMKLEIQSQDYTEVYATKEGFCRIAQNAYGEPSPIDIAPANVDELCRMLQAIKVEAARNREAYLMERGGK